MVRRILVAAVMALAAMPAWAQDAVPVTQQGNDLVLNAIGHDFTIPLPDWLTGAERLSGDAIDQVQTEFNGADDQALLEMIRKGESFEAWSTLYGARITLEPKRTLDDYRNAIIYGYSQPCKPELTGVFHFGEDDGETIAALGFVCGAFRDDIEGYAGLGEIMVTSFKRTEKGVAIVYQEWRGKAFDPSNPETWPIERAELQARADALQASTLTLAD